MKKILLVLGLLLVFGLSLTSCNDDKKTTEGGNSNLEWTYVFTNR